MAQLLGNLNDLALRNEQRSGRIDEFARGIGMGYSADPDFILGSSLLHNDAARRMQIQDCAFISALFAHGRELLQRSYGSSYLQNPAIRDSRRQGLVYLKIAVLVDRREKNIWLDEEFQKECKYIWWLFSLLHNRNR
jgi:hypothetical protein